MRCFGDPKDTIDSKQLKNQIYLLRFGHTRALLLKKKGHEMAISPVLGKLTHMQYKYAHIGVTCTFTYTHTNIRRIHAPILQYCKIAIAPRCAASDVCVSNKKNSQTIVAKINLPNV